MDPKLISRLITENIHENNGIASSPRTQASTYIMQNATDVEDGKFYRIRACIAQIQGRTALIDIEGNVIQPDSIDPRVLEGQPSDPVEVMFATSETTPDGLYFEVSLAPEDR